uniref:Ig-like domain-containing protein n=1 Tax=Sarcophilus harrisii TaxID=9305 RepID=G3VE21_SARHA
MGSLAHLLCFLLFSIPGSRASIVLTQDPDFLPVSTKHTATITCTASQDIDDDLQWYQQKPGQPPKLLIKGVSTLHTGVSPRFSGSGYGTAFTLTITEVETEDAGVYYCQQDDSLPLTVIQPTTKTSLCHLVQR